MPTPVPPPASSAALVAALPDIAFLTGVEGVVHAANAKARDLLGLDPEGLLLTTLLRTSAFADAFASAAAMTGPVETALSLPGGRHRHLIAHLAPLPYSAEILIVLRDLSREQAIEKMRSDFIANASHEMRTPLASIMGAIETLQGAAKNDAKAREQFLDVMLRQAHRMKRLIDDLLVLSRIELNEHVRPSAKVSLTDVARQAKGNLAEIARTAKVEVEISGAASVPVAGDAEELLQVAQNLLENALKYGAGGGKVELKCEARGKTGVLAVKDFGRGIAEEHIPRLTERFYRVNTQESRQRGGTGLGLAIVKHIVLRHRGKLEITSELGQGSMFSVHIPLYDQNKTNKTIS